MSFRVVVLRHGEHTSAHLRGQGSRDNAVDLPRHRALERALLNECRTQRPRLGDKFGEDKFGEGNSYGWQWLQERQHGLGTKGGVRAKERKTARLLFGRITQLTEAAALLVLER